MNNCVKCKFYDIDYEWDDDYEDEVEIETCKKGHELPCENECEDFKQYRERKYKEEFSMCDTCENLSKCIADGKLVEVTTQSDKSRHFVKGIIFGCRKDLESLKKYGIDLCEVRYV